MPLLLFITIGKRERRSLPPVRRLRLRGDWSDTGPDARPERETDSSVSIISQARPQLQTTLMQRMTNVLSRMLNDPMTRAALSAGGEDSLDPVAEHQLPPRAERVSGSNTGFPNENVVITAEITPVGTTSDETSPGSSEAAHSNESRAKKPRPNNTPPHEQSSTSLASTSRDAGASTSTGASTSASASTSQQKKDDEDENNDDSEDESMEVTPEVNTER